jgi:hypothetical protein
MTTPTQLIVLQRPAFDAITAGGMLLLVAVMSVAWLVLIGRRSKRVAAWGGVVLMLIVAASVAGDQLGFFSRLDVQPPAFVILVALSMGLGAAVAMGYVLAMSWCAACMWRLWWRCRSFACRWSS